MGSDRPQVIAQALTSKFTTMDNMKKIEDVKATGNADLEMWTIGDVYRNREMILAQTWGLYLQTGGQLLSIITMLATHRVLVQVSRVRP